MRGGLLVLAGFIIGVVATYAFVIRRAPPTSPPEPSVEAERELDRIVPSIHLAGVPFRQAVEAVRKLSHVPIALDETEMAGHAINLDVRVNIDADYMTLSEVLQQLCEGVDNTGALGVAVVDDHLDIVSSARLATLRLVHCYDVRDLLSSDVLSAQNAAGDVFQNATPASDLAAQRAADLVQLIRYVAPKDAPGGPALWYLSGRLVVLDTWAGHRTIRRILRDLRRPVTPAELRPTQGWDPTQMQWKLPPDEPDTEMALGRPVRRVSDTERVTIVYDVRDLDPRITPRSAGNETELPASTEEIAMMVEEVVGLREWVDYGGSQGYCRAGRGYVFVTHTASTQRKVARVIQSLRAGLACVRPRLRPATGPGGGANQRGD